MRCVRRRDTGTPQTSPLRSNNEEERYQLCLLLPIDDHHVVNIEVIEVATKVAGFIPRADIQLVVSRFKCVRRNYPDLREVVVALSVRDQRVADRDPID